MDKKTLDSILKNAYNLPLWRQVLTDVFGARNLNQTPQKILLPSNDLAENAFELGFFNTTDTRIIGLYQIDLKENVKIERNKVGLRELLRNIYKYDVDGALVVFVQNDKWQFSYISEIRVLNNDGTIETKATEPKRFTYLFGRGENCRTAVDRFYTLNAQTIHLKDLNEAFSVESLNKEFFNDYRKVFAQIENEIIKSIPDTNPNDKEANENRRLLTQRLFNRLMFIYFLQKKGWLIFEGDKNYLRRLFNEAESNKESFLNDRLFWLFFSGLGANENIDLHNAKLMKERRGEVPYLNGGLFEKDNDGFDERNKIIIDNRFFGDILDFFERYNFTVDESTPIDVEIAVDPEMLGKVFEELVTGRHDTGSYYTPREIVQFMCRESLKHYLNPFDNAETISQFIDEGNGENLSNPEKILDALKAIRICDPACGSGAYLLGMMQELLRLRESLFTSKKVGDSSLYNRKREIIESNIYGVDKDRFAIQIASLRLWLSLSIESNEPRPLPNLKYKIGCGDALLAPLENDLQSNLLRRPLIDEFRNLKADYSNEDDAARKSELDKKIEHLRIEIAQSFHHLPEPPKPSQIILAEDAIKPLREKIQRLINSGEKFKAENEQKNLNKLLSSIEDWKQQITVEHYETPDFFDWTVEFAEVFGDGGFDVILANPPYIQLQKDGGQLAKLYENKNFETFTRSGDIYSLFYERGFGLLKEKGVLCFITSNKWMRAGYGEKSRRFFAEKTKPLLIIDFGSVKVFSTATVDNNILMLQKAEKEVGKGVLAVRTEKDFDFSQGLSAYVKQNGYQLSALSQNSWIIGEKDEFDIKGRVEKQGVPLNKWKIQINYGIKTGFNEAFIIEPVCN